MEQLRTVAPSVDLLEELDAFRDYWQAKSGKDATKVDWIATFRSWCRRQHGWNVDKGWRPRLDEGDEWSYR